MRFASVLHHARAILVLGLPIIGSHLAQMALTVSRVTKDAAYKSDGTDMGFKLVRTVTPEETAVEVSPDCKMERPQ